MKQEAFFNQKMEKTVTELFVCRLHLQILLLLKEIKKVLIFPVYSLLADDTQEISSSFLLKNLKMKNDAAKFVLCCSQDWCF